MSGAKPKHLPVRSYQPRFRQSKVMTPFSSGVHLIPGEIKAGSLTSSVKSPQSPWLGAKSQDSYNAQGRICFGHRQQDKEHLTTSCKRRQLARREAISMEGQLPPQIHRARVWSKFTDRKDTPHMWCLGLFVRLNVVSNSGRGSFGMV